MRNSRKATLLALIALMGGGFIAAGCETEDPAEAQTEPTTEPAAIEVDTEPTQAEVNEKLVNQYVKIAPKNLAVVCQNMDFIGRERTADQAERILGAQILRNDGEPSEVIDGLLDHC